MRRERRRLEEATVEEMSGGVDVVTSPKADPSPGDSLTHYFHQSPEHCVVSFAAINRMRQNIQLCDVVLRVGVDGIHAHRVVLASTSPYFYAMFNDDMAEKVQREVVLHDVDAAALQLLVDYAYTGEIHITEDNVQVLLPASSLLQISSVREACCKFLMRQLHPSNCLGIRSFAGGGSLFAIHSECECYNPRDDRWLPIAPMLYRRSRSGVTGLGKLLYVVGGYDGASDLATAESYNPLTNKWTTITPMGTKRSCLGICGFDGLIYVCGGYDGASCLSSMERYDPLTGVWSSCPTMGTRRRYCRIAVVENCIYALGGFDSTNYQSSVERFDPRMGRWQPTPAMSSRRSSCGVGALDGFLYCIGGNDGTMCMSSGERFNIRRNAWEPIAPMHSRRSTHEVVACGGALLALGGNDGSSSLNSVERYDSRLNKWTLVTSMLTRRSSVGAAVLECFNIERSLPIVSTVSTPMKSI